MSHINGEKYGVELLVHPHVTSHHVEMGEVGKVMGKSYRASRHVKTTDWEQLVATALCIVVGRLNIAVQSSV